MLKKVGGGLLILIAVVSGLLTILGWSGWDLERVNAEYSVDIASTKVIGGQFAIIMLFASWLGIRLFRNKAPSETIPDQMAAVLVEEDLHRSIADAAYEVDKKLIESHLGRLFDNSASNKSSSYESSVQLALISIANFLKISPREGNISASLLRFDVVEEVFYVVSHSGLDRTRVSPKMVRLDLNTSSAGEAIKTGDLVQINNTDTNTEHQWYDGSYKTIWCIPYASTIKPNGDQKQLQYDHVLCVTSSAAYDLTDEDLRPILMLFAKVSLSTLTLYTPIRRKPRPAKGEN